MLAAQRDRRSGVYEVNAESTRTYLYFDKGQLVFAEQGTLGDTLGRVLVRTGKLTSEQYAAALRAMTQRIIDNEQMRFGEVVVELGFLTSEEVFDALGVQVKEKVIHCLTLEQCNWTFAERPDPVDRAGRFPTPVEPVVLGAMKRLDQDRLGRILEPARDRYPRLNVAAAVIADSFRLTGPEQRFASLLDGSRLTRELLSDGDASAPAVLAALISASHVELPVQPQVMPSSIALAPDLAERPAEVVVPRAPADPPDPHPATPLEHHAVTPSPSDRMRASIALKSFVQSRTKATRPAAVLAPLRAAPAGLDAHAARIYGEEAFQTGRSHMRNDMPDRALPYLRRAVVLCPEAVEFQLCLRWAERLTTERDAEKERETRSELWRLATQVVKEQPQVGFGHYVLGQFAKERGDNERAMKLFRHALELDPGLTDAARQLRIRRPARE